VYCEGQIEGLARLIKAVQQVEGRPRTEMGTLYWGVDGKYLENTLKMTRRARGRGKTASKLVK